MRTLGCKKEEITEGVLEMTGEDGHGAHCEGLALVIRMEEGKDGCRCGRFVELGVEISIQYLHTT